MIKPRRAFGARPGSRHRVYIKNAIRHIRRFHCRRFGVDRRTAAILTTALLVALAATGGWYHAHQALQASQRQFLAGNLVPMAALLKENQGMICRRNRNTHRDLRTRDVRFGLE
jgi:hypothetical protein